MVAFGKIYERYLSCFMLAFVLVIPSQAQATMYQKLADIEIQTPIQDITLFGTQVSFTVLEDTLLFLHKTDKIVSALYFVILEQDSECPIVKSTDIYQKTVFKKEQNQKTPHTIIFNDKSTAKAFFEKKCLIVDARL
jgi:hypothetical protein